MRLKVDVIVASLTPSVKAAKEATSDIPIVMAPAGDPLQTGLVASLARPGGNVTGVSTAAAEVAGKTIELIHEVFPSARRVAVLANATDFFTKPYLAQVEDGGPAPASPSKPSCSGPMRRWSRRSKPCARRRPTP